MKKFQLKSNFSPTGDQPSAIEALSKGIEANKKHQVLLGATGSGKTFTIANVIANTNRPAVIMAPNKTLAAQLHTEFKEFFPDNAVEYFVSYYDYYQPEAYIATSDTFIEKDASINKQIEQMRLSATQAILERQDTIIIASVSAIYGLGAPETYLQMIYTANVGDEISDREVIKRLIDMQYTRSTNVIDRGQFRARGEIIDIFPATSETNAIRLEIFDGEIEKIITFDPLTGEQVEILTSISIHPTSHYVAPQDHIKNATKSIIVELEERLKFYKDNNDLLALQRIEQRTWHDIEMMRELGYCNGIENYSSHLSGRKSGNAPPTLFSYLPENTIVVLDESHITIPQIDGMYKGDRARKENLVRHGFRLPSALDNRPMRFPEWEEAVKQMIMVSATPSSYEKDHSAEFIEQVIRPTGITDPIIEISPAKTQIDDLLHQIHKTIKTGNRILVTVLTKKTAEQLSEFLSEHGIKSVYLHSEIHTIERMEIIQQLRAGVFDVIVGINLLREGLDMPEVSLVAILDADKEGFLRSTRSLIQTIGRAARNVDGRVILYADRITNSMQQAISETDRRREIQIKYNKKHNIKPTAINKGVDNELATSKQKNAIRNPDASGLMPESKDLWMALSPKQQQQTQKSLRKAMELASEKLEFEQAAKIRDQLSICRKWSFF